MFLDYHIQEGFLFENKKLCLPQGSMRLNIVKELHVGGLGGHFGMDKAAILVKERYFSPSINKEVRTFVEYYRFFQVGKGRSQNTWLYMTLTILERAWEDVNMAFALRLPRMERTHDSRIVFVDRFLEMTCFI